jgi:hypothetical protein
MQPVANAAKEVTAMSSDMAKQTFDWATKAMADSKGDISKFVDSMTSDSAAARSMIQQFQDLSNNQLGLQKGASAIGDAAVANAVKQGAVQDTQLGIQQRQLGVEDRQLSNQDVQLKFQDELRQLAKDFRGDQQAIQVKADQLFDQYSKTYPSMMQSFAKDAQNYASPARMAQAGAEAQAGVGMQFQAARDAATRQLESFGIKPSDTRFAALDLGTRIKEASAKAAADRLAQLQTEDRGFQLRQAAITQGQALPGQSTALTGAANQAGSLVNAANANAVGAGNTAVGFGGIANQAGANANQAGANAIGAGNAVSNALHVGTGAIGTGITAGDSATRALTGALAADTGAAGITGAAGDLVNRGLATEGAVAGSAAPYVQGATGGINAQTNAYGQDYKNKMDQFKAESTNTSGLGALLGTAVPIAAKAFMTGGASLPFDLAGSATSKMGGDEFENYIIGAAEGGAIPMNASPSQGQNTDDVKAMLNAGEFIMPKDVTSWYGEKFFQNLIAKAQNEKNKAQAKPAVGPMPAGPPAVASGPSAMGAI